MELMIRQISDILRSEGASELCMGPCPMAEVAFDANRRLLSWAFHFLYTSRIGNQIFGFRSLYRFKDKFRPEWRPVYFAASPRLGFLELYLGCRMWGLY